MEKSVELKNIVLYLYESMSKRDISAIENIFSRQVGVLGIGSDPNEWWADYDLYGLRKSKAARTSWAT